MLRIAYSIFFLSLFSCQNKKASSINGEFSELSGYQIVLDQFTSPVEDYVQYVNDWKGQEAFAFHVRKKEEIKIYGLESGELLESLAYTANGPNVFQGIYDFHILNEDSIFLNRRYLYKTYLVNSVYEVLNELNFLDPDIEVDPATKIPINGDTFLPVFSHNRLFRKLDGKVFLTGSPDKNARSSEYFDSDCLLVSIDLETGEVMRLLGYQEKMKNKAWGPLHPNVYADYNTEDDIFIVSYEADGIVYLGDGDLKIIREFDGSPDRYHEIQPIPESARSNEDSYLDHYNAQFRFGSILYDTHRKLIYRIALEPYPDYGKVFLRDPLYKPRNMVVMAFDSETFEKRAEMRLKQSEEGVYLDRCFVNERGLNITYVDLEDEDKLYFKTFVVE